MKCMLKDGFRYLLVFFVLSAYLCSVVPVSAQGDQPGADGGDDVLPGDGDGLGGGSGSPDGDGAPAGDDASGSGDDEPPAEDGFGDGSGSLDGDGAPAEDDGSGSGDDEPPVDGGFGDGSGSPDGDGVPAEDDGSGSLDDDGAPAEDDASGSGDDESGSSLAGTASAPGVGPSAEECSREYACAGEPPRLCYNGRWIDVLDYEVNCVDGIDNDCDGTVDSEDTDCYQAEKPVKISMISRGYDVCNNNVGWSEPASAAQNCGGHGEHIKDCCCCYITSHIHDLGDIFDANSRIEIKYMPGFTKGCTSPMHVSYSRDGAGWELFYSADVTQETWSPKTTYEKTLTVPGNFRYIRIHIPVCYNDYSSAEVIGGPAPVCGNGICEAGETQSSCPEDCSKGKTIIIRSDDIGPWWSVDNAIYLTEFIKSKGVSQTLGIIPLTDGGTIQLKDDPILVDYLRGISKDPEIEIGISGLTHGYNEFLGISQPEAEEKIADAKQMIADSMYVEPVTFMPPYYEYDESTLHAAKNMGMEYFSAGWNAIDMGHGFREYPTGLWNIPATTDFYDWGTNTFYSANEIEESCEDALDTFGTCVIILYHHTFTYANNNIDTEKIALLGEVLDWVKDKEAQGVELKTIGKHKALEPPEPSDKYIVFRSDDFAAFWSVSSAISITETLRNRGVPQVLSIVPTNVGYRLDDDPVIADYLKVIKDDPLIEIALHGYDHSVHEFRDISYADAMFKVGTGLEILQDVLDITPTTFVPPYHEYNDNTLRALRTGNINLISSGYGDFVNGLAFTEDEYGILHLPIVAEFYNWGENRASTAQEIEMSCEYGMDNYNVCVIMLHHHMFVDSEGNMDPARVKVLTDVIDWAKNKEQEGAADIVRLKDIDADDL